MKNKRTPRLGITNLSYNLREDFRLITYPPMRNITIYSCAIKKASLFFLIVVCSLAAKAYPAHVNYLIPMPQSKYNSIYTNVYIYFSAAVTDENYFGKIKITTAQNKTVYFKARLFNKGKILELNPLEALPNKTAITVSLGESLRLNGGLLVGAFSFSFTTNSSDSIENLKKKVLAGEKTIGANLVPIATEYDKPIYTTTEINAPDETPLVMVGKKTNPAPGQIMLTTLTTSGTQQTNYLIIVDNNGRKLYTKALPDEALDFKKLNDSTYSYFHGFDLCYYILDKHLNPIDTVRAKNGYITDAHELQIDKDGNYYILANQYVVVDMSALVVGGNPQALVMGIVIQKLDRAKNVLFEWKSLDYLPITHAIGVNLTGNFVDYLHSNSIELDGDSALLLCSRHFNEVEKINSYTGEVIWRMGRNAGNQFAFPNDAGAFSYQHDARRLPNGNILIFDNGNHRPTTRYSRVVEYKVDEVNKIATKVWEYRPTPDIISNFMGSSQRLANGNTVIGWGGTKPTYTEIDSAGNVLLEMTIAGNYFSYRAFKFDLTQLLADNQSKSRLDDSSFFCNQVPSTITGNLPYYLSPGQPFDSIGEISIKANNKVSMTFVTPENFFSYDSTQLVFNTSYLIQNDTMICNPSLGMQLSVTNGCPKAKYRWSTNDSLPAIMTYPTKDAYYWVDIMNGLFTTRDSVKLSVADDRPFDIYGFATLNAPFEIHTYSVPYIPLYNYDWQVVNGNIISGFGTNAVEIQWGNKDTGYIHVVLSRGSCEKSKDMYVVLNKNTGVVSAAGDLAAKVYPNPSQEVLNVDVPGDFSVEIYDVTGRPVGNKTGTGHVALDLTGYSGGIYTLVIKSGENIKAVKVTKL